MCAHTGVARCSSIGTFHGGSTGKRLAARLAGLNDCVTLDDLRKNAPSRVTPISVRFKGYRVWKLSPNNQGIAALEMRHMLEPQDLRAMEYNSPVRASWCRVSAPSRKR